MPRQFLPTLADQCATGARMSCSQVSSFSFSCQEICQHLHCACDATLNEGPCLRSFDVCHILVEDFPLCDCAIIPAHAKFVIVSSLNGATEQGSSRRQGLSRRLGTYLLAAYHTCICQRLKYHRNHDMTKHDSNRPSSSTKPEIPLATYHAPTVSRCFCPGGGWRLCRPASFPCQERENPTIQCLSDDAAKSVNGLENFAGITCREPNARPN